MKIKIDDVVFANRHKAIVKLIINNKYLVHYLDGIGSDWMSLKCLRKE